MSEMKINNLSVDLLQDTAAIALFRQGAISDGKISFTSVNIQVPIDSAGNQVEEHLKKNAIQAARKTLEEAILVLDNYKFS